VRRRKTRTCSGRSEFREENGKFRGANERPESGPGSQEMYDLGHRRKIWSGSRSEQQRGDQKEGSGTAEEARKMAGKVGMRERRGILIEEDAKPGE